MIAGFSVTALLTMVVNLLVAFDLWTPTADQIATLTTFVVAVSSIIAAVVVRSMVRPESKLRALPPPLPRNPA